DALALVAAVDEETAEEALSLIEVEYEPLPIMDTPDQSLQPDAPLIHEEGNIQHTMDIPPRGDVEKELAESDIVLEQTYNTQFMEHAYLETEGGVGIYNEDDGVVIIWSGGQYAFRDQLQIARSLDLKPLKIRVIASPTGGGFGGKDEVSVQIHLALLAIYTKKPVHLHWSREESIVVGPKRHAMKSTFRIGAGNDGKLRAIDVRVVANAGAYDTISGPVLNLSLESSPGPYRYAASRFKGISVYTNNAMGGEFRAFGAPQVVFGLEQELDKLARRLEMDPIELRLLNAVEEGDISAIGHRLNTSCGIKETMEGAAATSLWRDREKIKRELGAANKYKRYGIGVASEWHAVGLGVGLPDFANIIIEMEKGGKITLRTGAIEMGQGNLTAYAQMLAEILECEISAIDVIHGDTGACPDSGSVTASRSIMVNGNAIINGVNILKPRLIEIASGKLGIPEDELEYGDGRVFSREDSNIIMTLAEIADHAISIGLPLKVTGTAVVQTSDKDFGDGLPHNYYTYITQLALVGVDTGTGEVEVIKVISLPEMGRAINIDGVEGQCEGSVVMGQGYTLYEKIIVENGEFKTTSFSTYILPTALDVPEHETIIVEKPEKTGPFGAKGVGEAPTVPIIPAIANAVYDAVGIRIEKLPITPEYVMEKMKAIK
ncbi:MAG: molybdopterin cofactor-binding domain-containing protein, partial [Candidatus Auribacterota bacterium]|nr:molybdopterin cofactor-binding domain-containing protein [Candidatus Auribacterota bacterium]